jgi:hypothetical protein
MAHKKNKKPIQKPIQEQTLEEAVGLPTLDPDKPEGMAKIFAAGLVDPRPGGYPDKVYPNQQWALVQAWIPTSKLWWDLGLRWHPELATKWLKGGGQFGLAEIVDEPPPESKTITEIAEEFAGDQFGHMKAEIERIRDHGTAEEKEKMRRQLETSQAQMHALSKTFEADRLLNEGT